MHVIDVWVVYGNSGERDRGPPTDVFSTELQANTNARERGRGGGLSALLVEKRKALRTLTDEVYLLDDRIAQPVDLDGERAASEEQERKAARAKLSPRERQLLGIK